MEKRCLIIGDFILDVYVWGTVEKVSPEAPVMEFLLGGDVQYKFGGAANVAYILDNLNVDGTFLTKVGVELGTLRGLASYGLKFNRIEYVPIVFGKTTKKIRLVDMNYKQHVLRIADEDGKLSFDKFGAAFHQYEERNGSELFDIVVFSDYQKGLLSNETIQYLRKIYDGIPIAVDSKSLRNYGRVSGLPNIDVATPNHKEAASLFSVSNKDVLGDPVQYAERIVKELGVRNCIITLGHEGAAYYSALDGIGKHIPTTKREIFDVTGAGDSFFSAVVYLWGKYDIETIVEKANIAAGTNVMSLGNALIDSAILNF